MKNIKRLFYILLMGMLILPLFSVVKAENQINVYFFSNPYCTNCGDMEDFLSEMSADYQNIEIIDYDILISENRALLNEFADVFNLPSETPLVIIGGLGFSGYNDQNAYDIEQTIIRYSDSDFVDIGAKILNHETILITDFDTITRDTTILPFIGEVSIESLSLGLAAVLIGLADGFNPCAMWVLIFLISMLINTKDRKRMWLIGLSFLFASALVYTAILVGWLELAASLITIIAIRIAIGVFAVLFGLFNLYRFFKNRKKDVGCEVTDEKQRRKLMDRILNIVQNKNLWLAIIGAVGLAVTVNLVELACSMGLPLQFAGLLALNPLPRATYAMYIGIYMFFFMLDDLVIFIIAMITFKVTGISNKYTKYSNVIGGIIMLVIGLLMIFFPNIIMFNF